MANFDSDDEFSFGTLGRVPQPGADTPAFSFDQGGQPQGAHEMPSFEASAPQTQGLNQNPATWGGQSASGITSLYGGTAQAPATGDRAAAVPSYQQAMDKLKTTTDPQQQAVLKDQIARNVFSSLKDAGHEVKWQGDQLMVDGRPYVVGGGTGNTGIAGAPGEVAAGRAQLAGGAMPTSGYEASKWNDANSDSAKYIVSRAMAGIHDQLLAIPDEAGRKAFAQQHIQELVPQLEAAGWTVHDVRGEKMLIEGHGVPLHWADAIIDIEGRADVGWSTDLPDQQGGQGQGPGMGLPPIYNATGQENTSYGGPAAPPQPSWQPGNGPAYVPGEIGMDDIPNYSFDEIYNRVAGGDDVSRQLLDQILANPESLDAHTVDTMKARSKDELAEQQLLEEEDIQRFGNQLGIDDSAWLASERIGSRRNRDTALVKSNRDIDITAATTNAADKRSAAQLGVSYDSMKGSQRQAAASLAADTTLRQAALRGDRMALRESVAQKAAELGISEDQVMSNWLQGLMDDATRRHGIDTGARIDFAKLGEQSREFQEELAYKLSALAQANEQFGASYGLDAARLERDLDNDAYGRYTDSFSYGE